MPGEDLVAVMDKVLLPACAFDDRPQLLQGPIAVGVRFTLTCASRRVPCSMTTNTYSVRNVAVKATKKSHATIAFAWFFRKMDQR
jgi:hypothetical protein